MATSRANNAPPAAGTDGTGPPDAGEQTFLRVLIRVVFVGATLGSVLALFARHWWFAELFSHFRLYYLLAQAVLLLVFMHRRHPVMLTLTILLAVPNAWSVGPYLLPLVSGSSQPAASAPGVSISVINLNYRNSHHEPVLSYVGEHSPDVLILLEFTPRWAERLAELPSVYPHAILEPREGPFGMAMLSRFPLDAADTFDLGLPGSANIHAVVDTGALAVHLFAVHLQPPTNAVRAGYRNMQLTNLASLTARAGDRVLAVGDLNLTPFSPFYEDLLTQSGLTDARRPQGVHVTWPTMPLPVWIPIDHCLAGGGVTVADVRRGRDLGSDHYPLEIRVMADR